MTQEEFNKILNNFENKDLEFRQDIKRETELEEKNRSAKTTVAFYNTRGGKIIFGVSEDGKKRVIVGLASPQLTESNFNSQTQHNCNLDESCECEFLEVSGKVVLIIHCPKGRKPPYRFKDEVLVRRGSNNFTASEEEIAKMYRDRSPFSYDRTPVEGARMEDIDLDKAGVYVEGMRLLDEASSEDDLRILNNIGIITKDKIPTIAGILLFGKSPQRFFPQAVIKADVKFVDDNKGWDDMGNIGGTILDQIESFEIFAKRNMPTIAKIIGFKRVEDLQFSLEILREIVVNALVHRDYGDTSVAITINIRKNKFIVFNPGGIVPPLSLETILTGYFAPRTRNEVIADAVLGAGYMDRRGNGLQKIQSSAKREGYLHKFKEGYGSFGVILEINTMEDVAQTFFIPDKVWTELSLDKDQKRMLRIIEKEEKVRLGDLEKGLGKTKGAFNEKLNYLLDKEVVQRYPARPQKSPKAYYALHERFIEGDKDSAKQIRQTEKGQLGLSV
ncbi:MAG: putative DNA binding domain-containing protein [Patescibacteria group bacterium]|nr:putative DNA binding domain-containing protein [Patescibacteria group bacterium]